MRYWAGLLVLAMLSGCGKDASIRLTRPEVEPSKTRRVHFSLTTADDTQVSATLSSPSQTIEMASAGQRSFDATIGDNLQVQVNIPDGFEVKDWNVVPGGNTDFNSGTSSIIIKNIQEDIRVSAVVHRIVPKQINHQKVYFNLETADEGTIGVTFGQNEKNAKSERFQGAGQRILTVPTGEDFHADLKLPGGWEVTKWELEGGDANLEKKPALTVSNVRETVRIAVHVRKIPDIKFRVRVKGTSHFLSSAAGSGAVKWAVFKPGEKVREDWSLFSQEGQVSSMEGKEQSSEIKSYPNGSTISLKFEFIDSNRESWYFKSTVTLDDHTMVDFDFNKIGDKPWDNTLNAYDVIGRPRKGGSLE